MKIRRNSAGVMVAAMVVGAGLAAVALSPSASVATTTLQGSGAAPGHRIAVVDLERLINGLKETGERNKELETKAAEWQKELDELTETLKSAETELNTVIPKGDNPQRRQKLREYLEMRNQAQTRQRFYQELIELERGGIIGGMYGKVQEAVAAVARSNAIDAVLLDDRKIDIPENAPLGQVNATLQSKKVLFVAEPLDITDQVLTRLNNDFAAGKR
jgi:Skp family chaperone for outer membrane proteins